MLASRRGLSRTAGCKKKKDWLGARWVRSGGEEEGSNVSTARATSTEYDGQVGSEQCLLAVRNLTRNMKRR